MSEEELTISEQPGTPALPPPPTSYPSPVALDERPVGRPAAVTWVGVMMLVLALMVLPVLLVCLVALCQPAVRSIAGFGVVCAALGIAGLGIVAQLITAIGLLAMVKWARLAAVIVLIAQFVFDTFSLMISAGVFVAADQRHHDSGWDSLGESIGFGITLAMTILIPVFLNGGMVFALTRQNVVQAFRRP